MEVDVVASTDKVDSYNSTIDANGWDLEQFKRNPQILWAHDDRGYTPSAGLPVANAIPSTIRIEGGKLLMRLRFTPKDVSEFGYGVFQLISNGFLHGLSVGFEPIEEVVEDDADGNRITKYKRQRLLEVSVVTIPANDDALVVRARKLNLEHEVDKIRGIAEGVERMAKDEEDKPNQEYIAKCVSYFEQKQPVNKAASGVMKKFYSKMLNEDPPADELAAWQRMGDVVDAIETKEEPKPEEVVPAEEEVKPEEKPLEAAPETPSEPTPPAEVPPVAQKASVLVPLDVLGMLPERFRSTLNATAEEALRLGIVPASDIDGFLDRMSEKLISSVVSQYPPPQNVRRCY